eukprot:UN03486
MGRPKSSIGSSLSSEPSTDSIVRDNTKSNRFSSSTTGRRRRNRCCCCPTKRTRDLEPASFLENARKHKNKIQTKILEKRIL